LALTIDPKKHSNYEMFDVLSYFLLFLAAKNSKITFRRKNSNTLMWIEFPIKNQMVEAKNIDTSKTNIFSN